MGVGGQFARQQSGAVHVCFGLKADIGAHPFNVRFVPKADIVAYSISSSARESTELGTVRPSALAVLRLITKSNLVEA